MLYYQLVLSQTGKVAEMKVTNVAAGDNLEKWMEKNKQFLADKKTTKLASFESRKNLREFKIDVLKEFS